MYVPAGNGTVLWEDNRDFSTRRYHRWRWKVENICLIKPPKSRSSIEYVPYSCYGSELELRSLFVHVLTLSCRQDEIRVGCRHAVPTITNMIILVFDEGARRHSEMTIEEKRQEQPLYTYNNIPRRVTFYLAIGHILPLSIMRSIMLLLCTT